MHKKTVFITAFLLVFISLAACAAPPAAQAPANEDPAVVGLLQGEWIRTQATLQRIASADQPVVEGPFTVLGTYVIFDESAQLMTEKTTGGYYLEGKQAEQWVCNLTGAYSIPVQIAYQTKTKGEISWPPEVMDTLAEAMTTPWQNVCIFSDIPTTLDDHTPLISSPQFKIEFELLDANTLKLFITFESEYVEEGTIVKVERTYIYERAD